MSSPFERRSFLLGVLGGTVLGGGAGLASGMVSGPSHPARADFQNPNARPSFAQQGEDLIMLHMFLDLKIEAPTYADIGAHDPVINNNTYLFYCVGCRGLLVEPNPKYAAKLRAERPQDQVLEAGISSTREDTEADYYVIRGDGELNTFSKEEADKVAAKLGGGAAIEKVIKRPLVNVNKALADHFPKKGPELISIDTEGLDLDILRALDFARFHPTVVCAETSELDGSVNRDIVDLMRSKGYTPRGGTLINTIFLADEALARRRAKG
jgi:FkbM family methyltransferase